MNGYNIELLIEAFRKQFELRQSDYWANELLEYSPPVLWFGDSSRKEKIVTIGANPSRREFLDSRDGRYLSASKRRFHHLRTSDNSDILEDEETLSRIIQSFDSYYHRNPYRTWFGRPRGSKVEGFLNGLGASLYGLESVGAVHADLIPFVTMSDFSKLNEHLLKTDLFRGGWAKSFFDKLMEFLNPSMIIAFGRTNAGWFSRYYERLELDRTFHSNGKRRVLYGISDYRIHDRDIPLVELSVNLGNPIGFTREMLNEFGAFVGSKMRARRF